MGTYNDKKLVKTTLHFPTVCRTLVDFKQTVYFITQLSIW